MLEIKEIHNGFEVKFQYKPFLVDAIKKIPNSVYIKTDTKWFIPSSSESALLNWSKNLKTTYIKKDQLQVGDIQPLPELAIDIPLLREMFPYQKNGVAYSLDRKRVIVGDQPGLGKSGQAIATAVGANAKCILIICPSTLKENWKREWKIWTGKEAMVLNDRVRKTWSTFYKVGLCNVFIVNYESLKKYFVSAISIPTNPDTGKPMPLKLDYIQFSQEIELFDMVILDEVHRCKDGGTAQAKFAMGITKGKEYVLALTGTPVVNKPIDLVAQLYIIGQLFKFGGYKHFLDRYCSGPTKASNLKELNYLMRQHCFYRREKKEVLKDLPDKMRNIVKVDISNRVEYNKAENNLVEYLTDNLGKTDGEITRAMRGQTMVLMGILKKLSAKGKIQQVCEHIIEVVEAGEKIVVFAWHKEMVLELKKAISEAVTVVGDDSLEARQIAVDKFQNDPKTHVIICNIKSGGVGITLTASSRVLFIELPWHPADCEQCEDRCHRIGQKDSVEVSYFLGADTIDEHIYYDIIDAKRSMVDQVTGSEVEVETKIVDGFINFIMGKKNK